jgi:uncharacterized protein DUF6252
MKKKIIYTLVAVACWWSSSCKKETSIESGSTVSGNFTAVINGVAWAAAAGQESATVTPGLINITGVSVDNREISISITDTGTGVYVLNALSPSLAAFADLDSSNLGAFSTSQSNDSIRAGGTVTITAIDAVHQTVTGTFSFNVYRTSDGQMRTITSGVFNQIPYASSLPAGSPNDTVTAAIDGGDWAGQSNLATVQDGTLTIVGALSNGSQSIALIFPADATAGTYSLTANGVTPSYIAVYDMVSGSANNADPGTSGSITILQNNTSTQRINGTFQFTTNAPNVPNSNHSIANGYFSVSYGQ